MNELNKIEQKVLEYLKITKGKYCFKRLAKEFNLHEENELKLLNDVLLSLQCQGKIYCNDENEFIIFPKNTNLKVGILKIDSQSDFYTMENGKKITIDKNFLFGAISGDIITYKKNEFINNLYISVVDKIVKREKSDFIFDVVTTSEGKKIVPYKTTFYKEVVIPVEEMEKLVDGQRIKIRLDKNYSASIIDYIGHKDDPDFFINTIASKHGATISFSKKAIDEAKKLPTKIMPSEIDGRLDLRNEMIFTIDGADTKDMDDAISLSINDSGNYILGVHIANVSNYIRAGSHLFQEALERGTSIYPGGKVIPMLLHLISNGICSLNEDVDRLTKSCIMEFDKNGKLLNFDICDSVIHSNKKMTYNDVNQILENNKVIPGYEKFIPTLKLMAEFHKILNNRKIARGYNDFGDNDIEYKFNNYGDPTDVRLNKRGISERMIEDFMLAANQTIGSYFYNLNIKCDYRVHSTPNNEAMKQVLDFISGLGIKIRHSNTFEDPIKMQNVLRQIKNLEIYPVLSEMILQNIPRAYYSTENIGHFGLGISPKRKEAYVHFTSPIRRGADLVLHYLIDYVQGKITYEEIKYVLDNLEEICKHISNKQKEADAIEREYDSYIKAKYIANSIDKDFIGTICFISKNKLTIKINGCIFGTLNISDLGSNSKIDIHNLVIYIQDREYHLGDKIPISIKDVDIDNGKIFLKYPKQNNLVKTLTK